MGNSEFQVVTTTKVKRKISSVLLFSLSLALVFCTKKQGTNPELAYTDKALLDSCKKTTHHYYKNQTTLLPALGPHGEHTLRFNTIAKNALDTVWSLPVGKIMPEGSMIIKDTYKGNEITLYSFMYKRSGSWLWGEIKPDGQILYGVTQDPGVCTGCHGGAGNRDQILSFK